MRCRRDVRPAGAGRPRAAGRGAAEFAAATAAPSPAPPRFTSQRGRGRRRLLIARQQIDLQLYDQAIDTLRRAVQGGHRQQAIDASFLIASLHDTRGDAANAMSTYIEIATRFPDDARAPEATRQAGGVDVEVEAAATRSRMRAGC